LHLHRAGVPTDAIREILSKYTSRTGDKADAEIDRAIERAPEWLRGAAISRRRAWPAVNNEQRCKVLEQSFGLEGLRARSTAKPKTAEEVLPVLFPSDPLIWVASSLQPERGGTYLVHQLKFTARSYQFIVPNPMLSRVIPEGARSQRCLQNTGDRRYLVIEFDSGSIDEQATIAWHLAQRASLVLVVHSGGKSLHSWFNVAGQQEAETRAFMDYAVSLGADSATWVKCQAVRMPGGLRPGVGRQEIVFFNPGLIGGVK
jgi:hypothetical protein